jgi:hypothetical protein
MSPEVSIEPVDLVLRQDSGELLAEAVLAEASYRKRDGLADGGTEFVGESLEFVMCCPVDPDARALHAHQHTSVYAPWIGCPPRAPAQITHAELLALAVGTCRPPHGPFGLLHT